MSGVAESPTLLSFTWLPPPPVDINGILLYYQVDLREIETGRRWTFYSLSEGLSLGSLHPYFTYQCEIAAHTVARGPFSEPIQIRTLETCKNFSIGPHIGLNHCTSSQITFAQRTCFILRTLVLFPFCHYCRSIHSNSTDIFSYSSHCSTWQLLRHFHQLNNHYTLMESTTF